MSWFPQIGVGSIAQFPLRRTRRWRSVRNQMENGGRFLLPDRSAGQIDWQLSFQELTDAESDRLSDFFVAAQGQFGSFLFIDPMANLLGWSADLGQPDWQSGLLTVASGAADPLGGMQASSLTNRSAGTQTLQQTLAVPGDYVGCFSAWVRSNAAGVVTLARDGNAATSRVGPAWKRLFISGTGTSGAHQSTFAISVDAGQTIDVWGLQAEAQPYPSVYKATGADLGIYEETYFGNDELRITSTGVGLSSCEINLTSRV
jgi:hypothetical protein